MYTHLKYLLLTGVIAGCTVNNTPQRGVGGTANGGGSSMGGSSAVGGGSATAAGTSAIGGSSADGGASTGAGASAVGGSTATGGASAVGGTTGSSTGGTTSTATGGSNAGGAGGAGGLSTIKLSQTSTCNITTPTTWTKAVYDATDCPAVAVSSTLTIAAGAIIKFGTQGYMHVADIGMVTATGTADDPIVFTSILDDAHGGDTNGDGKSVAEKGDWGCLSGCGDLDLFGSSSSLDYVQMIYGYSGLWVQAASVNVTNSVFAHNLTYGVRLNGDYDVGATVLTGNAFFDNDGFPLSLGALVSLDATNIFHDPGNASTTNQNQCIELTATVQNSPVSLAVTELAFYGNFDIDSALTVADGVTFKAKLDGQINLNSTGSITNSQNAIFTSFEDDSVGGDCTGDGDQPPNAGDWKGIWINTADASDWAEPAANIRYTNQIDYPGTLPLP